MNLRAIRAVGFDMDYTLIHYLTEAWERHAYMHVKKRLLELGWPVDELTFDPELVMRGLIIDREHGNLVKANRFGYVKRASHGTRMLDFEEQRRIYSRVRVDLEAPRWEFMNTFFSLSEACMYAQVIDLLDEGKIPGPLGYPDIYKIVRASIDETHMEGTLKSEIVAEPERFVVDDPEVPLALLDMKHSGKRLVLITNSEWAYTRAIMAWAFDRHLPTGLTWRDLFDITIVEAGKPGFFTTKRPLFEMVDEAQGLVRPTRKLVAGGVFVGGHAGHVEEYLGLPGEDILYVGDHIFSDVHVSNRLLRWRTALVVRELEDELRVLGEFDAKQRALDQLMREKEGLEHQYSLLRLDLQRAHHRYGPRSTASPESLRPGESMRPHEGTRAEMEALRRTLVALDEKIAPLAKESSELLNARWGLLMRAGNDRSHLARQVERYADVYTSRVSNFLLATPFVYLRSPRGSVPHDLGQTGGA